MLLVLFVAGRRRGFARVMWQPRRLLLLAVVREHLEVVEPLLLLLRHLPGHDLGFALDFKLDPLLFFLGHAIAERLLLLVFLTQWLLTSCTVHTDF